MTATKIVLQDYKNIQELVNEIIDTQSMQLISRCGGYDDILIENWSKFEPENLECLDDYCQLSALQFFEKGLVQKAYSQWFMHNELILSFDMNKNIKLTEIEPYIRQNVSAIHNPIERLKVVSSLLKKGI